MLIIYSVGVLITGLLMVVLGRPHPTKPNLSYIVGIIAASLIWPVFWIYVIGYIHGYRDCEKE